MHTLTAFILWFLAQFGGPLPVDNAALCQGQRSSHDVPEQCEEEGEPVKHQEMGFAPASISNGF